MILRSPRMATHFIIFCEFICASVLFLKQINTYKMFGFETKNLNKKN